jgi:hypothetical protein
MTNGWRLIGGEILEALAWDASQLDELLVETVIPAALRPRVVAIGEHLQRYQELLRDCLFATEAKEKRGQR